MMICHFLRRALSLYALAGFPCRAAAFAPPSRIPQSLDFYPASSSTVRAASCSPNDDDERSDASDAHRSIHTPSHSRREWLSSIVSNAGTAAVFGAALSTSTPASAAPPLTSTTADDGLARIERALRSAPPKVLRPRMNLDFAVLLMRASYNAVDTLDIVPMEQFQRDFFLIRQAEYQTYRDALGAGAVVQGDLADPSYFDFISFAQYATIGREIVDPPVVFEEQQPVEETEEEIKANDAKGGVVEQRFKTVVVRRDPSLRNVDLPAKHAELVGDVILDKLDAIFGGTASAIPAMAAGSRPNAEVVAGAVRQMVNLFVISGFAFDGKVSIVQAGKSTSDAAGTVISIAFTSPATLWSGQALKAKKAKVTNDFALKTARALVSRAGYSVTNASVKFANNQEISTFALT